MNVTTRRSLLRAAAAGPFAGFLSRAAPVEASLTPVADERDGAERLRLPEGFRYRSFHDTAEEVILDDGWAYDTRSATPRLVFQPTRRSVLDLPDSVATGPGGILTFAIWGPWQALG